MPCEINKALAEKILFATTEKDQDLFTKDQENHYLVCENEPCKGNLAFLKANGLFQMTQEQKEEYDLNQKELEANEDRS